MGPGGFGDATSNQHVCHYSGLSEIQTHFQAERHVQDFLTALAKTTTCLLVGQDVLKLGDLTR